MDKPIHWLLTALNHHMHYLDEADKAYPYFQDLQAEVMMWRKRYLSEHMSQDTQIARGTFMALPSANFQYHDPDEIADKCRKGASDG